ncbi:hypothetical protein NM208_g9561 [Fusarium decemcellulare]|uniref:Uncharacterized protein n=1 Tax=Fusarium decemcellulare TaxID=57161 RepID=A0ACC1S146_9HYPO|nr:hypothetical protein NM208_g9561 [Fusarium decemcellulare]
MEPKLRHSARYGTRCRIVSHDLSGVNSAAVKTLLHCPGSSDFLQTRAKAGNGKALDSCELPWTGVCSRKRVIFVSIPYVPVPALRPESGMDDIWKRQALEVEGICVIWSGGRSMDVGCTKPVGWHFRATPVFGFSSRLPNFHRYLKVQPGGLTSAACTQQKRTLAQNQDALPRLRCWMHFHRDGPAFHTPGAVACTMDKRMVDCQP